MPQPLNLTAQHPDVAWPQGDALDRALTALLRPPPLPIGFHAGLQAAIEREIGEDILARRSALETDRRQRLAELQAGFVRVRRHTLLTALAAAFTLGAGASLVLPWLATAIPADVPTLAIWFATMLGLGFAATVPLQRFLPRHWI